MCGIAGFFSNNREIACDIQNKMLKLIKHRGPDDEGVEIIDMGHKKGFLSMGFVRLSILDVSANGHQPMSDELDRVVLTFNGEVYNAFELKNELEKDGIVFKSNTDTEVILQLYLKYGIDGLVKRINGMFSIALFDRRDCSLFLLRDHMGVKPLYYYKDGDTFLYASEIKAFYAHENFCNELNNDVLGEFLMYRYVAGKDTLFKNVFCVEPGHYLKIQNNVYTDVEYWNLECDDKDVQKIQVEKMVKKSIEDRLLSDVKLGVQLSGGVDSSLVAYYASKKRNEETESYSVVFDNKLYSEKKYIDYAAKVTKVQQHQLVMRKEDVIQNIGNITFALDSPMSFPNSIGIYLMSKMASENGVKVLLTGEGADEVFGGYPSDSIVIFAASHPCLMQVYNAIRKMIGKVAYNDERDRYDILLSADALYSNNEIKELLTLLEYDNPYDRRKEILIHVPKGKEIGEEFLNYKTRTYLVELCMRQDKMTMASSVEGRVPFCNYKLFELMRSQRLNDYIKPSVRPKMKNNKIPLKNLCCGIFGKDFTYRNKSGFPLPIREYFDDYEFSNYINDEILPVIDRCKIFNMKIVSNMWINRMKLNGYDLEKLWLIISFGMWYKMFMGDRLACYNNMMDRNVKGVTV